MLRMRARRATLCPHRAQRELFLNEQDSDQDGEVRNDLFRARQAPAPIAGSYSSQSTLKRSSCLSFLGVMSK
jgi:hypothetical protein